MDPHHAFESLKLMIGDWRVEHDHGRISTVNYKLSCCDSVLVETWALKPGVESLTLYHMDGDDFIATHYCPLGNQPRLLYRATQSGKFEFETTSITNLTNPLHDHCRAFSFEVISKDRIFRSETYAESNKATEETGVFHRL